MSCPKCESDDWKSASFVHKSGMMDLSLNTSSLGAGAGLGTGGLGAGAGLASSRSRGTQQSRLSVETAPPEEPKDFGSTVWFVLSLLVASMAAKIFGDTGTIGYFK